MATSYQTSQYYKDLLEAAQGQGEGASKAKDELARIQKEQFESEYGPKSFDISEFQDLLGRLEGSKMRQQRQKSVEGRRDIMSQGLASMMSNF